MKRPLAQLLPPHPLSQLHLSELLIPSCLTTSLEPSTADRDTGPSQTSQEEPMHPGVKPLALSICLWVQGRLDTASHRYIDWACTATIMSHRSTGQRLFFMLP